jgi:hypothetical protein
MHTNTFIRLFRCCLCGVMVFTCINATAQSQGREALLKEPFNTYSLQALQEKLFVHTDKNFYLAGEICWFKIYNTDAVFNKPLGISKLAYIEVLDTNNKPVLRTKVALEAGSGNGSLQLPVSLVS